LSTLAFEIFATTLPSADFIKVSQISPLISIMNFELPLSLSCCLTEASIFVKSKLIVMPLPREIAVTSVCSVKITGAICIAICSSKFSTEKLTIARASAVPLFKA
jgi:hypothetical protein